MDVLKLVAPLTQNIRLEAKESAREALHKSIGEKPDRERFTNTAYSKYPKRMTHMITVLCLIVLVGAFLPSSFRLYVAGSTAFAHGVNIEILAIISGVATVLLAEIGQVVSSLAAATLGTGKTSKRILYCIMLMSTFLALVGNWSVAMPYDIFSVVEAIFPPLIVLGMSFILKEQMLIAIEERHQSEKTYQKALDDWQVAVSDIESHPAWKQHYASALRDRIIKANKRKKSFDIHELNTIQWRVLVHRELKADNWYSEPVPQDYATDDIISLPDSRGGSETAPLAIMSNGYNSI